MCPDRDRSDGLIARETARKLIFETSNLTDRFVVFVVEIHSAVKDESVSFHLLHAECGSRIRNRRFCPVCNKPLESHDLVRGYEIEKGRYVRVTDVELEGVGSRE